MLELKNVAVAEALGVFDPKITDVIRKNNIINVQQLIDIMSEYPNIDWSKLDRNLGLINHYVELAQEYNKEPVLYDYMKYEDEKLNNTDKLNSGDVLLLSTPTTNFTVSYDRIRGLNIASLKKYLQLTNCRGNNFLFSNVRGIGESKIPGVLNAINMYTEQVIRQSELTDNRNINLFTYQKDEKRAIVMEKYAEIIVYLVYNTKEFVWSSLTDVQKKAFLSSVVNDGIKDEMIKDRMIDIVTNYMTLPELECVLKGDYKVLRRFIKQ